MGTFDLTAGKCHRLIRERGWDNAGTIETVQDCRRLRSNVAIGRHWAERWATASKRAHEEYEHHHEFTWRHQAMQRS
jgi:hypothetical protein